MYYFASFLMTNLFLDPSRMHPFFKAVGILKRLQKRSGTYFTFRIEIFVHLPSPCTAMPCLSPMCVLCSLWPFPKIIHEMLGRMFVIPSFECVMWLDAPVSPIQISLSIPTSFCVDPNAIVCSAIIGSSLH